MNLLFVIKSLSLPGGGAERVLAEVTSGLAQRGHEVSVVSFDPPGSTDFYNFDARVLRIRLGIEHDRPSGARTTVKRAFALRRLIRESLPSAAIGFMHSAYIPLTMAITGTGVPAIASEHIVYQHYSSRPLERSLIQMISPLLYAFTAISEPMLRGFPIVVRRKMTILPNPVSVASDQRADLIGGTEKIVLSVGRLEDQKDHATLLRAFAMIAERFPEWRLRILGEGTRRTQLQDLIQHLGLGEQAVLAGATSDISAEYLRAQLFAIPSTYESFGLATAEALAHGLPIVGFADCPGTNELVSHNENGLLVAGSDRASALAKGLAHLMGSVDDRVRMGMAAPIGLKSYSREIVVDRWVALADAAASNAPRPT